MSKKEISKKLVLSTALVLIVALTFGAVLIASFNKGSLLVADSKLDFKTTPPIANENPTIRDLNDAFIEVSEKVTPATVYIEVTTKGKENNDNEKQNDLDFFFGPDNMDDMPSQGSGSGVIISSDGYIMTNNHVVTKASDDGIKVVLTDKREFHARLIGTDPNTDIAVIKIDADNLPVASVGNSDEVKVGEWVLAIGNPLGLNNTVTSGIVSAIGRNIRMGDSYSINNFIQTDAVINPGNSGGALVDMNGYVIGINAAIKTNTGFYQGYGFAIPINIAKEVAQELIEKGKVARGYIGVSIKDVDIKEAKGLGLNEAKGVLIQGVQPGSGGEEAGLKIGDIILKVDGQEVNASNQLQTVIGAKDPGDVVDLTVFRNGDTFDTKVTLKEAIQPNQPVSNNAPESNESTPNLNSKAFEGLGLKVSDMTGSMLSKYGVSNGIYVTSVGTYTEAFNRGLREGLVITEADKSKISSVEDLASVISDKNKGDVVMLRVVSPAKDVRLIALEVQ
ncbi:MAG: Do family serine endopeptidase [Ignavibacteriae bacterium]|nr:Do family serine endopeptidase [Ignavibacteriota bacterium]MCB9243227.1 Do family serine endopeptidase [Ignavibacteriales bacterium]